MSTQEIYKHKKFFTALWPPLPLTMHHIYALCLDQTSKSHLLCKLDICAKLNSDLFFLCLVHSDLFQSIPFHFFKKSLHVTRQIDPLIHASVD